VGFDQAVDDAYPTSAATPEPTQIPQPGSTEFWEAESDLLKTPPLFSEPSELKSHQEWWYKCENILKMIKQLTQSMNPHYPWDIRQMQLQGVNKVILKWNIHERCPPQEALIDIDELSSYYVWARLCWDIESFRMTIAQFTQYANTHHCYNHTQLELMGWVIHKDCVVSDIRWRGWALSQLWDMSSWPLKVLSWPFRESTPSLYREDCFPYGNDRVQLNTSYQLLVYSTPHIETLISTSTNL